MSEVLFSEQAKHYLLSTDDIKETVLITVTPSEANVLLRYSAPNHPGESNLVAQSTTIDNENFSILLKPYYRITDAEKNSESELTKLFLQRLHVYLTLVKERRSLDTDFESKAVDFLRQGVSDLLKQLP